jgi:hypothetical protein
VGSSVDDNHVLSEVVKVKDSERVEQVILRKVRLQNAAGELPPVNHASQTPLPDLVWHWVHLISECNGLLGPRKNEASASQQIIYNMFCATRPSEAPSFHEEVFAIMAELTQFCW